MILSIAQTASLFLLLLVVGVYWGPWIALSRSLAALPAEAFLPVVHQMNRNLATVMTVLSPLVLLSLAVTALLSLPDPFDFGLALAALALVAATVVVSVAVEVPIVKLIVGWTLKTMPADWESKRDRWVSFHLARVVPGAVAFVLLAVSTAF